MSHMYPCKRGARTGRPFFILFLKILPGILLYSSVTQTAHAGSCPARHISERVRVIHVYDGDTVKLEGGRRLRFIGINTPETRHHDQVNQPFAGAAKTLLQELLDANNRTLLIQPGKEQQDRYGRLLAHAFLEEGGNIAVRLLQKGLATTLVVPPNTWGRTCYQQHENRARGAGRGIWGLESYKAQPGRSLPVNARGFHIIRGKVEKVRRSQHNVWVNLEGPLVIRISNKDDVNFEPGFVDSLAGHHVETRGWIKPVKGGLQMSVRHPAALARITLPENVH